MKRLPKVHDPACVPYQYLLLTSHSMNALSKNGQSEIDETVEHGPKSAKPSHPQSQAPLSDVNPEWVTTLEHPGLLATLGALDTWRSRDLRSAECASLTTRILDNSPLQSVTGVLNFSKKKTFFSDYFV